MMILTERLKSQIEKHMADEQAGFRKDRSTVQQILALRLIAEKARRKGKKIFNCFVDFIPKVACTSWKVALCQLTGKDLSKIKSFYSARETDRFVKRAIHYSPGESQTMLKKYYKFMISREPLERLVSAYRDKLRHNFAELGDLLTKLSRRSNNTRRGRRGTLFEELRETLADVHNFWHATS